MSGLLQEAFGAELLRVASLVAPSVSWERFDDDVAGLELFAAFVVGSGEGELSLERARNVDEHVEEGEELLFRVLPGDHEVEAGLGDMARAVRKAAAMACGPVLMAGMDGPEGSFARHWLQALGLLRTDVPAPEGRRAPTAEEYAALVGKWMPPSP